MQTKKLAIVALFILALFLTGCSGEVVSDLYVQDIIEVVEGTDEPLFTFSTILLESPGDEYNTRLMELLEFNFKDATNFRTVSQNFSTYIAVDVKIPLLNLEDYEELWDKNHALGIVIIDMEDGSAAFGLALNSDKLDALFTAFGDEVWHSLTIEDFIFTVKLINDMRNSIFVSLQGVYVNQVPVPYEERFEMARRDILEIRLGDVARDAAYEF